MLHSSWKLSYSTRNSLTLPRHPTNLPLYITCCSLFGVLPSAVAPRGATHCKRLSHMNPRHPYGLDCRDTSEGYHGHFTAITMTWVELLVTWSTGRRNYPDNQTRGKGSDCRTVIVERRDPLEA